jgi:hypothetical protein
VPIATPADVVLPGTLKASAARAIPKTASSA